LWHEDPLLGHDSLNKHAANNKGDLLLSRLFWIMDISTYYRLVFESTRISAVASDVLLEVSRGVPPFKCLNNNNIRTRSHSSRSFQLRYSLFDAIEHYILTESPLSNGSILHDKNMTDVRNSEVGTTSAFLTWDPKTMYDNISINGSTVLVDPDCFFSFLIYTQSVGLLGRGISPSQGRYLRTEQHKHRMFRTHDPSVQVGGHCDRQWMVICLLNKCITFKVILCRMQSNMMVTRYLYLPSGLTVIIN
jgi:hypothetical protein